MHGRRSTDGDIMNLSGSIKLDTSLPLPHSPFPTLKRINEQQSTSRLSGLAGRLKSPQIPVQTSYSHVRRRSYQTPQRLLASRQGRNTGPQVISDREIKQTKAELRQMTEENRARQSAQANIPDWANSQPLARKQEPRKGLVPLKSTKDVKVVEKGSARDMNHQIV